MTHISKKKLDSDVADKLFKKLAAILERAQNKKQLVPVLEEILTKTEKIMIAKRLAIILMLLGETPQHRIAEALLVSPTTISKFSLRVEKGEFYFIEHLSKKEKVDLEKIVWLLLTAGGIMPPRTGRTYWRKKGYKTALD